MLRLYIIVQPDVVIFQVNNCRLFLVIFVICAVADIFPKKSNEIIEYDIHINTILEIYSIPKQSIVHDVQH